MAQAVVVREKRQRTLKYYQVMLSKSFPVAGEEPWDSERRGFRSHLLGALTVLWEGDSRYKIFNIVDPGDQ